VEQPWGLRRPAPLASVLVVLGLAGLLGTKSASGAGRISPGDRARVRPTRAQSLDRLQRGLVLGGERLYDKVRRLIDEKGGPEEVRWSATEDAAQIRERVHELMAGETDDRIKIWARVSLGGERGVDVARECGYRDGSGVRQVVKRLEIAAHSNRSLHDRLEQLRELSRVKR